jgi:hypothetical protein
MINKKIREGFMNNHEFQRPFRKGPIILRSFLPEVAFNYSECMQNIISFVQKVDAVCENIDEPTTAARGSVPETVNEICEMLEGVKKCLVKIHNEIVRLEGIEAACQGGGDPPRAKCQDFNTLGGNL